MAATGTVGILRALLTADASAFQSTMKKSADAATSFGKSVTNVGTTAQKVTPQLTRLEKAFQGDKLLYTANNLTRAITNIGGAAKLTDREMEKVNRTLTDAIAKYRALGQAAPKAMLDLEKATRKTGDTTGFLNMKMIALGTAIGAFASSLALQGVRALGSFALEAFETAGQITDLAKQTGLSTDSIQEMQAVAAETGQSLETFTNAAYKLGLAINGDDKSVRAGLKALGLEWAELRGLSMDEQFRKVMQAAGELGNEVERNRALVAIFGERLARELSKAVEGYTDVANAAKKSTQAQLEALDAAGDRWAKFVLDIKSGFRSAMGEVVLGLDAFSRWFARNMPKGLGGIGTGGDIPLPPSAPSASPKPPGQTFDQIVAGMKAAEDAAKKAAEAQRRWNEAFAEANQGMTWWLAGMKTAPALITSIGDSLSSDFLPAMRMSTDAIMAFATQGQDSMLQLKQTIVSQNASATQTIARYWKDDLLPVVKEVFDDLQRYGAQVFAEMLVGLRGFKEAFLDIWRAIRQALANILAQMLTDFLSGYLRRMLAGALGSTVAGAAAGAGTAAAAGAGGAAAGTAAAGAGGAAAGTAAGAGGGLGATIAGLATNPITIAAAGALALGLGIWKKGWFRGGEEGVKVNPARDAFLRQFGGFDSLAGLLTSITGEPGGGRLFKALAEADTMKEFNAATRNILTLLQRRGVSTLPAATGQRWPSSPLPTLNAATAVMPGTSIPAASVPGVGRTGQAPVQMNVTIQAWDRADMSEAFRTEIIPRFKDALQLNQAGLRTAVESVG